MLLATTVLTGILMITQHPLPYIERLDERSLESIEGIVIHCTETPDLKEARAFGERVLYEGSLTGNSGHFYIDLDGSIEQYVPLNRVAHHVAGHNRNSIGIELVNRGRWPNWLDSDQQQFTDPYPQIQIDALIGLLKQLQQTLPQLVWINGHQQLDTRMTAASNDVQIQVARKLDPGPLFPWSEVLENSCLEFSHR